MSETVTLSNFFYDQTVFDLQDKRHQVQLLSERAIKIQQTYSKHETQLLTNLERQQNALSKKIKEHISLKEFEQQLFSWRANMHLIFSVAIGKRQKKMLIKQLLGNIYICLMNGKKRKRYMP